MTKKSKGIGFFGSTFEGATKKNKGNSFMEEFSSDVAIPGKEVQEISPKSGKKA